MCRASPEGGFVSCTSRLRGEEEDSESGGDTGGEEGFVATDAAFVARRFSFCRAFFAFLLSCFVLLLPVRGPLRPPDCGPP